MLETFLNAEIELLKCLVLIKLCHHFSFLSNAISTSKILDRRRGGTKHTYSACVNALREWAKTLPNSLHWLQREQVNQYHTDDFSLDDCSLSKEKRESVHFQHSDLINMPFKN